MTPKQVAILGGGNMGGVIAHAMWVRARRNNVSTSQMVVAEPDVSKHANLCGHGHNEIPVVSSAREAIKLLDKDGVLFIAVKPQVFGAMAAEIASEGGAGSRLVVSVMAGVSTSRIHRDLGEKCRVVRVMPNLPVIHQAGMIGVAAGPGAADSDMDYTRGIFRDLGECIDIPESMMDAMTAVASSGTAYVFYLAEAMIKGAIEVGFEPDAARKIVAQTISGAARMINEEPVPPEELRRRVTSKGGTTQAATEGAGRGGGVGGVLATCLQ
jgi:pyrroline-5-carboxylate reductase